MMLVMVERFVNMLVAKNQIRIFSVGSICWYKRVLREILLCLYQKSVHTSPNQCQFSI